MMVDGLDSCPNTILVNKVLQLSESGLPLKLILTAMKEPSLGSVLANVARIRLESVINVSQYVPSQLVTNFQLLKDIHSDLATAIVTGAG